MGDTEFAELGYSLDTIRLELVVDNNMTGIFAIDSHVDD